MYNVTPFKDKNNKTIHCGDLLKYGDTISPITWYHSCYIWNNQIVGSIPQDAELQLDILQTSNMEIVGHEEDKQNCIVDLFSPLKVTCKDVTDDIDIIDLKCGIIMTHQGHTFKMDSSIIIHN